MFGSKSYYNNPDWVLAGDAPSDYKDIVYGNANYGASAPYRNIVNQRSFGSPSNYGFFMTQNPAQHNPEHGRASRHARRAGMRIPSQNGYGASEVGVRRAGMRIPAAPSVLDVISYQSKKQGIGRYGAPPVTGTIPCMGEGATDASVIAEGYADIGDWVSNVQRKLEDHYPDSDLGLTYGIFDANMKANVKEFQEGKGLTVDGVMGPDTYKALFGEASNYESCQQSSSHASSSGGANSSGLGIIEIPFYMKPWFYWVVGGTVVFSALGLIVAKKR